MIRIFACLMLASCAPAATVQETTQAKEASAFMPELPGFEERLGGTLGLVLMDGRGEAVLSYNSDTPMAFCSAFKFALGAAALDAAAMGRIDLDAPLGYRHEDLPGYSPVLERGDGTTTLREAIAAAVTVSDNGAANLLIDALGGPDKVTQHWREWGDTKSRLDRRETGLNANQPGDLRDTSTSVQMAETLRTLDLSDLLEADDRKWLFQLGERSTTGLDRVRAGLPEGWRAGDKTGTCRPDGMPNQQVNDIGWIDHPNGKDRYYFAVMVQRPAVSVDETKAIMAELGDLMARAIGD